VSPHLESTTSFRAVRAGVLSGRRRMWPKFVLSATALLVMKSFHLMPRVRLWHVMWNACSLRESSYQKPAPEKWSRFMAPVSGACAVAAICHKSWGSRSRPSLSILQSCFLSIPLVDFPGSLGRALSPAAKHFDAIYAVKQLYKIHIDV